jgi:hypothetical protein
VALCVGLVVSLAVSSDAGRLAGRSRIELGAGFRNHEKLNRTEIRWADGLRVGSSTGVVGSLTFSYFDSESLAMTLSWTIHDVETDTWVDFYGDIYDETTVVHSLMLGFRFYFPQSRRHSPFRPYLALGAGPFMGTTELRDGDWCDCDCCCDCYSESETQAVFGARLGGGVDFLLGRHFIFGATGAYNFVDEFDEPLGGRYDYSGSEFGISLSYLFGR